MIVCVRVPVCARERTRARVRQVSLYLVEGLEACLPRATKWSEVHAIFTPEEVPPAAAASGAARPR
jgi:hypothetical protein